MTRHAQRRGPSRRGSTPGAPAVMCAVCGYDLAGATASSACPECGTPLVDCLVRNAAGMRRGRRYTSATELFGLPILSIATGPDPVRGEMYGKAVGVIAIGDSAYGWLAIGGFACGGVAIGGGAVGVLALGGGAIGGVAALGGGAGALGLAAGGGAIGGIAAGGGAVGVVAAGAGAVGYYAAGAGAAGTYILSYARQDPEALRVFEALAPLLGPASAAGQSPQPFLVILGLIAGGALAVWLLTRLAPSRRRVEPGAHGTQE